MELGEDFESYKATKNVIKRLVFWKEELEEQLSKFPMDATIYGQISEIELSIKRLRILANTELYNDKATVQQLENTPDDYRLMCENGYKNREKWTDAKVGTKKIIVKSGTYIINN
ncbi:hypothetical protein [Agitococcus lubricus]|uniref:Uncharacterized protein n=1 Tax=Agitococcus lubricus TaxID=1077255 RepID=A0A2T5IS87_9GAMM|nr:hypothetical protein [Agitococcus lubricus]PTQ86695.1 hypothetical protein C8N29_1368 [Agitococcus lubricus]